MANLFKLILLIVVTVFSLSGCGGGSSNANENLANQDTDETPSLTKSQVIAADGGVYHSIFLKEDGTVWEVGVRHQEEGKPSIIKKIPQRIAELPSIAAIEASPLNSFAIDKNGKIWSWGVNTYGVLGDGSETTKSNPVMIADIDNVKNVISGPSHTFAFTHDGKLYAWGLNSFGQLGNGQRGNGININGGITRPLEITTITGITKLAVGAGFTVVLKDDGTVWGWGENYGLTPKMVNGLTRMISVTATNETAYALKDDGTVWECQGSYFPGQEDNVTYKGIQVSGLSSVVEAVGGSGHVHAVRSDGTVWSWGDNNKGQLGDGTTIPRSYPVMLSTVSNIISISSGGLSSIAMGLDGSIWTWGSNAGYQAANGSNTDNLSPILLQIP
ncbi:MAG: RCC1 domain-containing protein [Trichloromonadaceae bacterium]